MASDRSLGLRWARWATRRRGPILWSALFVGIATALIAARLPLQGDMSHLLPPQTQSVRDLRTLEGRAQVFGTIIVAIESDDPERRGAAARMVRDRLAALPAGTIVGINYDSAAKDRFVWEHRHLLIPTEDLTAIRDELAQRKARLNPLFVALEDDAGGAAGGGPSLADRLRELKQQLDAAKSGAERPTPLVSKDGRLQIIVVRTPFASGEVSRNAPVLAAVRARGRRSPPGRRGGGALRDHRRRRRQRHGAPRAARRHGAGDPVHRGDRRAGHVVVLPLDGRRRIAAGRAGARRDGHVRLRAPRRRSPEPGDGVPGAHRRRERHQLRHHPARALLRGAAEDRRSGGGAGRGRAGQPGRNRGRGVDGVGVVRLAARHRFSRLSPLRPDRRRRNPALLARHLPGAAGGARGARGARPRRRALAGAASARASRA